MGLGTLAQTTSLALRRHSLVSERSAQRTEVLREISAIERELRLDKAEAERLADRLDESRSTTDAADPTWP